jgi:transposase
MRKLTTEQRAMIIESYLYFESEKRQGFDILNRPIRQRVADCLGVGEASVSRVVKEFRVRSVDSPPVCVPAAIPAVSSEKVNYAEIFAQVLQNRNLRRLPTTASDMKAEISQLTGTILTTKFILRQLKSMGCSYIKGKLRDPRADDDGTIAFRTQYLRNKASNYNRKNNPKRPEVYLDESYCNLHHVAQRSWLLPGRVRYMRS